MPGHCDPTVNLHDHYVCVRGGLDGGTVEAVWPVTARGCVGLTRRSEHAGGAGRRVGLADAQATPPAGVRCGAFSPVAVWVKSSDEGWNAPLVRRG